MDVPVEVLESGGVVPVKYVTEGKDAGVEVLTKKELKEAPKEDEEPKKSTKK